MVTGHPQYKSHWCERRDRERVHTPGRGSADPHHICSKIVPRFGIGAFHLPQTIVGCDQISHYRFGSRWSIQAFLLSLPAGSGSALLVMTQAIGSLPTLSNFSCTFLFVSATF
jgi:hypothetical protein